MSPEQLRAEWLDARSDIFALGVVLYQMFTGVHPFQRGRAVDTIAAILNESPRPLRALLPDMPELLEHVVQKALAKDRDLRYQSAQDLRADLIAVAARIESGSGSSGVIVAEVPRRIRRRALLAWTIGTLAAATGLAILVPWARSRWMAPVAPISQQQVTFTGDAAYPALSPDGKLLAYLTSQNSEQTLVAREHAGRCPLIVCTFSSLPKGEASSSESCDPTNGIRLGCCSRGSKRGPGFRWRATGWCTRLPLGSQTSANAL